MIFRFFNYKGTYSVILLALVDPDYKFIIIDVGSYGRNSDGGVFSQSAMGRALAEDQLQLPADAELPGASEIGPMPHVIVADAAFPLKRYIMRPYPGQDLSDERLVFNYRLSRARRIVENAFGILASVWKVYTRRIRLEPENVDKVVKATCALHNFLITTKSNAKAAQPHGRSEEATGSVPASTLPSMERMRGNRGSNDAADTRDKYAVYFSSRSGAVDWQNQRAGVLDNEL